VQLAHGGYVTTRNWPCSSDPSVLGYLRSKQTSVNLVVDQQASADGKQLSMSDTCADADADADLEMSVEDVDLSEDE
jgi:hypothetical protein